MRIYVQAADHSHALVNDSTEAESASISVVDVKNTTAVLVYGRDEVVLMMAGEPSFRAMKLSNSGHGRQYRRSFAMEKAIPPRPPPRMWFSSATLDIYMMFSTLLRLYAACVILLIYLRIFALGCILLVSLCARSQP
ncbi:hypothetical protein D9619_011094 [Psilocybe cf. subviscida]|uniref:Uncharacterized protein n=1 Tax=Psilocybe cf. subviscida TaxID=2480587 RepID=A0A8H5F5L6_9AGAR|nr:hypothetical protein D9619_011094 [Psilocybe cf. subviscida]